MNAFHPCSGEKGYLGVTELGFILLLVFVLLFHVNSFWTDPELFG